MARLEIVDSGILYINRDPSQDFVFASHPHPLPLSATEYICTYQHGYGMYSPSNNVMLLRSRDGGVTWDEEGPLFDKTADGRPYSYHDGFLSRMGDGTLVVFAFRADRSDPKQKMFSDSGGLIANETILIFSRDGGRTWTKPQPFGLPRELVATPACPVVELADGRWLATFDRWHGYHEQKAYKPLMLAFFSADKGQTWGQPLVVADGEAQGKGYWHGKTIRLRDGRLFTLYWAADMTQPAKGPVNLPIHYAYADPTGRNWQPPQPTQMPGQTNYPAELPDGTLAAIYTLREAKQPGFMVALSRDGGQMWDVDNAARVWDATGWETLGISSPDKYPRSHDTIAFGAPSLIATPDGGLYASWWCTYASLTHIRWAKLRVQ